jgi:hypothetical protein
MFDLFQSDFDKFIEDNKLHKYFYYDIDFYEKNDKNKRFCAYCLYKKVIL